MTFTFTKRWLMDILESANPALRKMSNLVIIRQREGKKSEHMKRRDSKLRIVNPNSESISGNAAFYIETNTNPIALSRRLLRMVGLFVSLARSAARKIRKAITMTIENHSMFVGFASNIIASITVNL
jgi:hypothetical protein